MSGGQTNQSSNYNSSIAFSPRISGHGSITNGNISTGSSTGSLNGSSTGGSGGLDLALSPKLQNLVMLGSDPRTWTPLYLPQNSLQNLGGHGNFAGYWRPDGSDKYILPKVPPQQGEIVVHTYE